jgi:hypothetical protein
LLPEPFNAQQSEPCSLFLIGDKRGVLALLIGSRLLRDPSQFTCGGVVRFSGPMCRICLKPRLEQTELDRSQHELEPA